MAALSAPAPFMFFPPQCVPFIEDMASSLPKADFAIQAQNLAIGFAREKVMTERKGATMSAFDLGATIRIVCFGPSGTAQLVLGGLEHISVHQLEKIEVRHLQRSTHVVEDGTAEYPFTDWSSARSQGSFHDRVSNLATDVRKTLAHYNP